MYKLPPNSESLSFSNDHILGCTFEDVSVTYDLLAATNRDQLAATVKTSSKFPTAMVFNASWGQHKGTHKQTLRVLIDSGSSMFAIANKRTIEITQQKLRSSHSEPYRVRTGSGVIETNASVWHNQHLSVGDTSVSLEKVTLLDLKNLPYDMILGYPFLTAHNPIPNWKTGALKFKNFTWNPVADYTNVKDRLASLAILDSEELKQVIRLERNTVKHKISRKEKHVQPLLILASMRDVFGEAETNNILDIVDPARSGAEKRDGTLAPELTPEQRAAMNKLLKPYTDEEGGGLFTEKDNLPHIDDPSWGDKEERARFAMPLNVDETKSPPHAKPRHMGPKEKAELKRQLIWLLTHGFIQPSKSRYSSPVLFVKKSDGTLRFCIDYRAINDLTATEHFPLPRIPELIDTLSQSNYFTALDAVQGYHQFPLTESSYEYTAFTCPFGHFEYRVIPFGLKNAVGHYQRVLSSLVGNGTQHASYCCNLIDDVLIHSKTFEEHIEHVKAVLATMKQARIFLNLKKCMFGYKELKWMGHILGGGTRKPCPDRIKDVCNYPIPNTVSEVRSLLGVVNYLGDYIPNLQEILKPFATIRSGAKNAKITLNDEQLKAWDKVKEVLTSDCVLKLPDFNKTFFLQTDASEFAIGVCLMQPYDDILFPVEYFSRTLKAAQLNYAIYDKELLAMQEGMRKFRPYLQHAQFVLLTDHKPLTHLRKQEQLNMRQIRFLESDAEFDYKVVYIKGEDNIFADFLSRPPGEASKKCVYKSALSPSMVSPCALCRAAEVEDMYADFDRYPNGSHQTQPPRSKLYKHTCGDNQKVTQADIDEWMSFQGTQKVDDWALSFDEVTRKRRSNAHVDDYLLSMHFQSNRKRRRLNRKKKEESKNRSKRKQTLHTCELLLPLTSLDGVEGFEIDRIIDGYEHDKLAKEILSELQSQHSNHHYNRKYQLANGLIYLLMGDKRHIFGDRDAARIYVPDHGTLREDLVRHLHESVSEGHRDADSTYLRCAERLYFPGMYKFVMKMVKTCEKCQRSKYIPGTNQAYHQPLEEPSVLPWTDIATDFICGLPESICPVTGAKFNKIQLYVCRLSRKVHLVPGHSDDTAEITAMRYRDRVFPHDGIPRSIVSDRDPIFTNKFWTHLGRLLGTKFKLSSGHRPQTDGLSERMVGVVTTMISIFVNYRQNDWVSFIGMLQFALNRNAVANRGKESPFIISQGYNPFAPSDAVFPKRLFQRTDAAKDFVIRQKAAAEHALEAIRTSQDIVARRLNKKAKPPHKYEVGDRCYIQRDHIFPPGVREQMSHKLKPRWFGPYMVIENVGPCAVKLDLRGDKLLNHNVYHVESTKPCSPDTRFQLSQQDSPGEWHVNEISAFNWRYNKPTWLIDWGGITFNGTITTSTRTYEPLDSLIDRVSHKPIQKLIAFEEKRTHLKQTLETGWSYPRKRGHVAGSVVTESDGWKVYHSKKNDTMGSIAQKLQYSYSDLFWQNVIAFAIEPNVRGQPQGKNLLQKQRTLPVGTTLRLPRHV